MTENQTGITPTAKSPISQNEVLIPPHIPHADAIAMPPPQKGYKAINHHDVQYRWIMQNRSGNNELRVEASAPVNGQLLIASLPRIVSYDMVTEAIDFANTNGWKPNQSAAPFLCRHTRHGFRLTDPS